MSKGRVTLAVTLAAAVGAFFWFDLEQFVTFDALKGQRASIEGIYRARPLATVGVFVSLYALLTGPLLLPVAVPLTLVGGAIFGLLWGTVIVSFASTMGATLAMLASRCLFRDVIQTRYRAELRTVNARLVKEGTLCLLALRLAPVFPFFLINLVMGVTPMPVWRYIWVSQAGMLLGTVVYVNAGTRLDALESAAGILSPALWLSFVLLALVPFAGRGIVRVAQARRVYRGWNRPKRFDRNLIVIGAGSAGLVAAYIAAAVRAQVTLIEKDRMGGDCLNTGCVPSKALIRTARVLAQARRSEALGIRSLSADFNFADVMDRVNRVVRTVAPHDSVERYTSLGVECLHGEAHLVSPWEVEVRNDAGTTRLTTRAIVVAAGARPFIPPIPGIDDVGCVTSDTVWALRELPRRLVVLGGGPTGCELAQTFARLGSEVWQVEQQPRLLMREDPDVSDMVVKRFRDEGIHVMTGHTATRFTVDAGEKILIAVANGTETRLPFDELLCAVGRVANTDGYGLEALGIETTAQRTIETNEFLETKYPNILACGDVAGPYQFTHTASHQAWYASVNALFGNLRRFRADYLVIPWATFTEPEVARVGLNESEATARAEPYEVTRFDLGELDRAIADEATEGMVKVLTVPGKDRILGVTIVGEHAGDVIAEFVLAMRHGLGLGKILGTIHIYPTLSEANKSVAGAWRRAHVSAAAMTWLERYHRWMRH